MKKVTSITLGGRVFAVEEDAYETLAVYLASLERSFADTPDYAEIQADIEQAIADKFAARERSERAAVTDADVAAVVAELGTADEVAGETGSATGAAAAADATAHAHSTPPAGEGGVPEKRRLYRDEEEAVLGGVAAGIAQYLDVDPVIIRLAFVLGVFLNGLGLIAYLILWLAVPAAKTTTERYAMRGERVTVADMAERVKKNVTDLDSRYAARASGVWRELRDVLTRLFGLLGIAVKVLLRFLRYLFGVVLVVGGALGLAALAAALHALLMYDGAFSHPQVAAVGARLLSEPGGWVVLAAGTTTLLIPLLFATILGVGLLTRRRFFTVGSAVTLFILWVVAVALVLTTMLLSGPRVVAELREEASTRFEVHAPRTHDGVRDVRGAGEVSPLSPLPPSPRD